MEEKAAEGDGSVTAEGVWPPPPTGMPPPSGAALPLPPFAPLRPLARPLLVLLTAYAATTALAFACAPFPAVGRLVQVVGLLQAILLLGIAAYFLVWIYRLSKNLRAFGVTGLWTAPAWTVFSFFIPVLNLYRPYQTFREIWQASDPGPAAWAGAWRQTRPPALLGFWWASVLLMCVLDAFANEDYGGAVVAAADNAADLLCALLTARLVRTVTTRQEAGARAVLGVPRTYADPPGS